MKKILSLFVLASLLLMVGFASAGSMGSIWTTSNECGEPSESSNHYEIGEQIYLNGIGFYKNGAYNWTVKGNPGRASCDSGKIVATGSLPLSDEESFCFPVYIVQEGDCGVYKVRFGMKVNSYRVKLNDYIPNAPEFGTVVGVLTVLGALGVFFVVRKR